MGSAGEKSSEWIPRPGAKVRVGRRPNLPPSPGGGVSRGIHLRRGCSLWAFHSDGEAVCLGQLREDRLGFRERQKCVG